MQFGIVDEHELDAVFAAEADQPPHGILPFRPAGLVVFIEAPVIGLPVRPAEEDARDFVDRRGEYDIGLRILPQPTS